LIIAGGFRSIISMSFQVEGAKVGVPEGDEVVAPVGLNLGSHLAGGNVTIGYVVTLDEEE
jgi:hypothetical protein